MFEDNLESQIGSSIDVEGPASVVRRVVRVLDDTSVEDVDVLLSDLMCAAWPTLKAQSQ
jgi:hypothetical protein